MAARGSDIPEGRLVLICGDDDFAVKKRAAVIFAAWCGGAPGDVEQVEAAANNAGEALRAIGRLREAVDTLPFFGGGKIVWFKDCTFLGDDRTASSQSVTAALTDLAEHLGKLPPEVRCLISGGKPDKRRAFFKTFDKSGAVEVYTALTADDRDWAAQAEVIAVRQLREIGKTFADDALAEFVARVGPNARSLASEAEKVALYCGDRAEVTAADVRAITARQKTAKAFALGEALGERDLGRALRALDEELWEIRAGIDKKKTEVGLLYGMISKVRMLIFLKELVAGGHLRGARDYNAFKSQLERLPDGLLPDDKRLNPVSGNPYPLFLASKQAENYQTGELVAGMDALLEANRKLVGTNADEALVLQQVLVSLIGKGKAVAGSR
jgi:DNA polymerase III subunit delta